MGMAARSGRGHGLVLLLLVAMFGAQRVAAVPSSLRTVPAELLGELGVLDAQSNDLHEALEILAAEHPTNKAHFMAQTTTAAAATAALAAAAATTTSGSKDHNNDDADKEITI